MRSSGAWEVTHKKNNLLHLLRLKRLNSILLFNKSIYSRGPSFTFVCVVVVAFPKFYFCCFS